MYYETATTAHMGYSPEVLRTRPAFVRDYGLSELGTKPELFGTDVYLGQHPPRLSDFLDDEVAADVEVPAVQKMVVVQGIELTPPA